MIYDNSLGGRSKCKTQEINACLCELGMLATEKNSQFFPLASHNWILVIFQWCQ